MRFLVSICLITVFFASCRKTSFCQNVIRYERKSADGIALPQVYKIIFEDTISGNKTSFNISKDNPFNNLDYKKIEKSKQDNIVYELSTKDVNKLIPISYRSNYSADRRFQPIDSKKYFGTSNSTLYDKSKLYSAIGYSFFIYDASNYVIGVLGSIIAFNSKGQKIYENRMMNTNITRIGVTENGKYLSYLYGDIDEDGTILPSGYCIIDIKTKKPVIDKKHENIVGPSIVNNLIIIGFDSIFDRSKCTYNIFDLDKNCIYSKEYYSEELLNLLKITDSGFLITRKDNSTILDAYIEKFKKEKIQ